MKNAYSVAQIVQLLPKTTIKLVEKLKNKVKLQKQITVVRRQKGNLISESQQNSNKNLFTVIRSAKSLTTTMTTRTTNGIAYREMRDSVLRKFRNSKM